MTDLNAAEVLERAADLIEPVGAWTQDMYRVPGKDCFCAVGAVGMVLGKGKWIGGRAAEDFVDANSKLFGMDASDLEEWNDTPGRTQAEVVAALRQAAALAREQGK